MWIQLRKFTLAKDWSPVKLDVAVEIPQILDLSFMKASGQQPDEILMPDQVTGELNKLNNHLKLASAIET